MIDASTGPQHHWAEVGHAITAKRPVRICSERTSNQPRPERLVGSSKQESSAIGFHAQSVGIANSGRSACIRLTNRNLDDLPRIERRKSLRFRSGADRMFLEMVHFKVLIKNDLQITSSSWHPVCLYSGAK